MSENQKSNSKQEENSTQSSEFDFEKIKEAMQHNPETFKQILSMLNIESSSDEIEDETVEDGEVIEEFISENDLIEYNSIEDEDDETVEEQLQELQQALNNLTPQTKNKKRNKNKKPIYDMPIKEVPKAETPVAKEPVKEVSKAETPVTEIKTSKKENSISGKSTKTSNKSKNKAPKIITAKNTNVLTLDPVDENVTPKDDKVSLNQVIEDLIPKEVSKKLDEPLVEEVTEPVSEAIEEIVVEKKPINKPIETISKPIAENDSNPFVEEILSGNIDKTPETEEIPLTGSFIPKNKPEDREEKSTADLKVPLNGSFGIETPTDTVNNTNTTQPKPVIPKTNIPPYLANVMNKQPKKPVVEKPVIEKPVVEKPVIEKTVIEKPIDVIIDENNTEPIGGVFGIEDEKPLTGSFTLKEKIEDFSQKDVNELDVPLDGSFGVEPAKVTTSGKFEANDDKKVVQTSSTITSDTSNTPINSSVSITKPIEDTVKEQNPVDLTNVVIDENSTEPIGGVFGIEEEKPLTGSFTLKEKIEDISQKDVNELDVPLDGSFDVEPAEVTVSGKFEASDSKKPMPSTDISFKDGDTYDIDSIFSAILQTADNFKDKNVSAVEFAEKVKNILEKK